VMTVHAAKGLEFPVVAVADLGRGLLLGGRPPSVRIDRADAGGIGDTDEEPAPPRIGIQLARFGARAVRLYAYDELEEEAAREEAAEGCRLAYVAATRAQDRLILSGSYRPQRSIPEDGPPPATPVSERLVDALGIDEPDDGVVSVRAPQPRPGLEASFPPGRIAVRLNRPDPASFRALIPAPRSEDEPALSPTGAPPIADAGFESPPAPGHLSYSALADYSRCGYRFYVTRVLGLAAAEPGPEALALEGDELAGEADLGAGDARPGARERRFGFGAAVHSMLEWSARNRWAAPGRERCAALLRGEGLAGSPRELERATAMVRAWLASPLRAALASPSVRLHPETPFMLALGGTVIRGKIDLLAVPADGEIAVVDYKTDALGGSDPADHADRYATQRAIYALAAREALAGDEPRAVRTAYCFLERPEQPVEHRFEGEDLELARSELEELVAGVRSGRFEVTSAPHRALCFDCPARARLCSHPPEVTMAARGP
jgi:ATP-dependent helicase/nuclease subunit A